MLHLLSRLVYLTIPPLLRGGVRGGLKTEIFHFGGVTPPPTPRHISAKNFWFIMVSPGPG